MVKVVDPILAQARLSNSLRLPPTTAAEFCSQEDLQSCAKGPMAA